MDEDEETAPGWEAIDGALSPLYGSTEPSHWGPIIHARIGGTDYIDGISAYRSEAYAPHWHFITYGFSELYTKESDASDVSGWGFELTLRVKNADDQAPKWPLGFFQNLGRYVYQTGNVFGAGHYMNLNGPIALGVDTQIRAITFAPDPQLSGLFDTPNGSLQFLQVVGITLDELQAIKRWNGEKFLAAASRFLPGLTTDLDRPSLFNNPDFHRTVNDGIQIDGSSTGALHVSNVHWRVSRSWRGRRRLTVTVGANAISDLIAILPARVSFQRNFALAGPQVVSFVPSERTDWEEVDADTVRIGVTTAVVAELAETLRVKAGEYSVSSLPSVAFIVEQSVIKDTDGNVVEWVG